MIYEIGSRGLKPCGVNENEARNSLPIGTVLQLNGYNNTKYVIVKNLGISERFAFYGATYLSVSLDDLTQNQKQAYTLKHISQKQDDRIQTYITDEIKTPDEVLALWESSEAKRKNSEARQKLAGENRQRLIEQGKELFAKHIPAEAKALIIAEHDQDESDSQTDYFSHRTIETVILGYSLSNRDNFKEMRKLCGKIPETKHLETPPTINDNGKPMTEENKSYWSPKDEHREKYSMGAGYYLKAGFRDSNGWSVKKIQKWQNNWQEDLFVSIAKRCVL
jgi:hypothetical protein